MKNYRTIKIDPYKGCTSLKEIDVEPFDGRMFKAKETDVKRQKPNKMDKLILKRIAKDWCKSILLANGDDSFADDELLTIEDQAYIVEESHKIAERITKEPAIFSLEQIIKKYYELEQPAL